eukprot:1488867-Pyramimonas_sp.AAC.1
MSRAFGCWMLLLPPLLRPLPRRRSLWSRARGPRGSLMGTRLFKLRSSRLREEWRSRQAM